MPLPVSPVRLTSEDLVLREWREADVTALSALFDDPDIALRTPLASPFDLPAACAYLQRIKRARDMGQRLHLAITADGHQPLGEVLINMERGTLGYGVGKAHRGRGLAVRATRVLTDFAHNTLQLARVTLEIEADNAPSVSVARALGFRPLDDEPITVEEKGRSVSLFTWAHDAPDTELP